MITNWIFEENAEPLMRMLSWLVGYEWDERDRDALVIGLSESHGEADRWFSYSLDQDGRIDVQLALDDPGCCVVMFRIDAPTALHDRIEFAIVVAQEFDLEPVEEFSPPPRLAR